MASTFALYEELGPEKFAELLVGREAKCAYGCGQKRPSRADLAFFKYRGPGGEEAEHCGVCGFADVCHLELNPVTGRPGHKQDHAFVPREPNQYDEFYCGCRGWD